MELERWPVVSGSFRTGNPEDPVALVILGAEEFEDYQGCAIYGSVKTENLGLEKMVANTVSNPNIRYFLLAGEEVKGHRTGNSLKALLENGLDESGRIIGAEGAIPYIENIPREAVERFREQITLIDMVGTTDRETLQQKIFELQRQNPGPLDKPPLVFEKKSKEKKETPCLPDPGSSRAGPGLQSLPAASAGPGGPGQVHEHQKTGVPTLFRPRKPPRPCRSLFSPLSSGPLLTP